MQPGERIEAGPFDIELIHMTHSIPDACAVAATCDLGTVLVTGDYKFDQTPVDGVPADMSRLAELGREGVLVLCGDSTNADRARLLAERDGRRPAAAPRLRALRGPHRRHVASRPTSTACSRSSTPRSRSGARSALVGRSMRKNVNIARSLNIARVPGRPAHPAARARRLARREAGRHLHRIAGRAAAARCAAWPTATTPPSSCGRATPSCSPRRRSPATSARSTRRSTGCTTSGATSSRRATSRSTPPATATRRRSSSC